MGSSAQYYFLFSFFIVLGTVRDKIPSLCLWFGHTCITGFLEAGVRSLGFADGFMEPFVLFSGVGRFIGEYIWKDVVVPVASARFDMNMCTPKQIWYGDSIWRA